MREFSGTKLAILIALLVVSLFVIIYPKRSTGKCFGVKTKSATLGTLFQDKSGIAQEAIFTYQCWGIPLN